MSYDIYLTEPKTKKPIKLDKPLDLMGGIFALGGTTVAWLNVTYNYAIHYDKIFGKKGIRTIYGMTGAQSIPLLKKASEKLKDNITGNYWEPTEGNAKDALFGLIGLAEIRPDGIWNGD